MTLAPDKQRSFWWLDLIVALLLLATAGCIFFLAGHGAAFYYMLLIDRPLDTILSPWGQVVWAALLVLSSSWLPKIVSRVARWLAILLLAGFGIWICNMAEGSEITFFTAIPLFVVSVMQLIRTIQLQRRT